MLIISRDVSLLELRWSLYTCDCWDPAPAQYSHESSPNHFVRANIITLTWPSRARGTLDDNRHHIYIFLVSLKIVYSHEQFIFIQAIKKKERRKKIISDLYSTFFVYQSRIRYEIFLFFLFFSLKNRGKLFSVIYVFKSKKRKIELCFQIFSCTNSLRLIIVRVLKEGWNIVFSI